MGTDVPPAAICLTCGSYGSAAQIGEPCAAIAEGGACDGWMSDAQDTANWARCSVCDGVGCEACRQSGWVYAPPS